MHSTMYKMGFLSGLMVKNPPANQETWLQSLGQQGPLEKERATYSSVLAWEIPWTRNLAGYSQWGRKDSNMTQKLNNHSKYIIQVNNKCLLYSTRNSTLYFIINYNGKESKNEQVIYICITELFAVHLTVIQHCKSTIIQLKIILRFLKLIFKRFFF